MNKVSNKVIYPSLSYEIIGAAFDVFNSIGYGLSEKYYQRAYAKALEERRLSFKKEQIVDSYYQEQKLGKYFLDFVVENSVVVELKVRPKLGYVHIKQVMDYLKAGSYKLAILIYFTREGIKYRRVININYAAV